MERNEQVLAGRAPEGCVSNLQRFSLHDGGGIRTVVFLKGCPFRCPWCCNPENLSATPEVSYTERLCIHCSPMAPDGLCTTPPERCPTEAKRLVGQMRGVDDVVAEVARDAPFFEESGGGMTISGGECLLDQEFCVALMEACHERGIHTAIETTLAVPIADPEALLGACDELLVDLKVADRSRSLEVCGIDCDLRDDNLRRVLALGARVIARMPIIPDFTDSAENVDANIATMLDLGIDRADVLPFHQLGEAKYATVGRDYSMGDIAQLSEEDVAWVADACEAAGIKAVVHGE